MLPRTEIAARTSAISMADRVVQTRSDHSPRRAPRESRQTTSCVPGKPCETFGRYCARRAHRAPAREQSEECGRCFSPSPGTPGEGGVRAFWQTRDVVLEEGPHPTLSRRTGRGNVWRTSRKFAAARAALLHNLRQHRIQRVRPDHVALFARVQEVAHHVLGDRAVGLDELV